MTMTVADATCLSDEKEILDRCFPSLFLEGNEDDNSAVSSPPRISSSSSSTVDVVVQQVQLPRFCSRYHIPPNQCIAFSVSNVLSSTECDLLIHYAEKQKAYNNFKYVTEATHIAPDGSSYVVPIQNPNPHKLSVFYHPQTLSLLWNRLRPILHETIPSYQRRTNCGMPIGLNPRIRILRYDAADNDRFEPHFDATTYIDTQDQQSLLTVLIYLNNGGGIDFSGGETCYLDSHISSSSSLSSSATKTTARGAIIINGEEGNNGTRSSTVTKVIAETGKVVVFEHDLYHSGAPLISGTKYVLRTDVMFHRNKECTHEVEELKNDREETMAENGSYSSKENTATSSPSCSTINLVIDLCHSLSLSEEEMTHLDNMCVLDMTLENLFANMSISSVKCILQESGLPQETIHQFVDTGLKLLKNATS